MRPMIALRLNRPRSSRATSGCSATAITSATRINTNSGHKRTAAHTAKAASKTFTIVAEGM